MLREVKLIVGVKGIKSWYEENGRFFNIDGTEVVSKVCNQCKEIKLFTEFVKSSSCKFGIANKCRRCVSENSREYRKINKEAITNKNKEYYKNNKEYYKEYNKEYIKENREYVVERRKSYNKKYQKENKEAISEYRKEYQKSPQGKEAHRRACHKRRALELNNGGSYTLEQWEECKQFFNNECAYSGQSVNLDNVHIEHIKPISNGGTNYIWNICPSLDSVNMSKHDFIMEEWYRKQEYFTEERLFKIYEWQGFIFNKYGRDYDFSFSIEENLDELEDFWYSTEKVES